MYSRILVPIDGSSTAQCGLNEAMALAHELGSALHLLHVFDARLMIGEVSAAYLPPGNLLEDWRAVANRLVTEAVSAARSTGITVDGVVRCDPALRVSDVIVEEARTSQAELIVMGTHGWRRGFKRVGLGSDAELVLRKSTVPVLLVRGPAEKAQH